MQIAPLCEHPQHLTSLAQAHLQAFGGLLPDWTLDQALAELAAHDAGDVIPTTWIALDGDAWRGSVSLLANDDARIDQYTPWLASLYVRPEARAAGTGAALVQRCVEAAAALGVPRLHLYCQDALVPYYARLGWTPIDRLPLGLLHVVVMAIEPGSAHV
ncbi:Acetyltransferase (GNAT) family protein [Pseudoxanthomonas sp. GM95]|uniref:GNAT family N-acetyltransferase n=1 Tax=Pseudoxanthomonas sp. GM95 TaxID=1881043 RepID=UPI0008B197CF|nr:GNAT family N-acetyltransferase [Pseudoxanthomonas sp. GM95]SEK46282.1 Acetyltransferase (GNAT) family protein [Pseudoxanthomonas sp. GM95]